MCLKEAKKTVIEAYIQRVFSLDCSGYEKIIILDDILLGIDNETAMIAVEALFQEFWEYKRDGLLILKYGKHIYPILKLFLGNSFSNKVAEKSFQASSVCLKRQIEVAGWSEWREMPGCLSIVRAWENDRRER